MIYLDHAATTCLSDAALQTFMDISKEYYGNPSSIHWAGRKTNTILRQARVDIAQSLDVNPESIIFTSGGSEADTLAIQGYALANQHKGKHLITTAIEHHAVLHTMEYLKERFGFEVTYIKPINQVISAQQIKEALRPDTILVSVMYVNNETGLLLPIQEIGEILSDHQAVFHVDAVQAIGKLPVSPEQLGIDFLAATAHKFHGPKGVGFLYSRIPNFDSLIHGGRQENQHRAGTENLAGIAAMATALKEQTAQLDQHFQTVADLKTYLLEQLTGTDYYLNETGPSLPYVISIGFPRQLNEQLLMRLDLVGIAVSSGSACTAGVIQTSHVLEAFYGPNSHRLTESIRISFSYETTKEELDVLVQQLHEIIGGTY
ncbi:MULTISPECIES: cysteine desulfurase family protein [unclassified Streptococcus]|uniref:cysteine desulfurase family protein n=1 Tax=unclassified Streptococcus TaxID=2608887 RepID=UPI0010719109|nr:MULTISPECIES: cysteine desulfurase family protein [unclassified Streptococcus]MBF0788103.1 cysteine desulfurase [Streptococcus sp. 19428wC2_LYSM12]MCQ9212593.1 cysteine desulfurase [Streptococcus sp. B01]MCQ9213932.1 cysteine desulfurase [Streptococcus sp. O1]TFV04861.1 cysteine desulfurase [Streptococcus sp. LYSM12]